MAPTLRAPDGLPIRLFRDTAAWEAWLSEHHTQPDGLWLKLAKKVSRKRAIHYLAAGLAEVERAKADGRWEAAT